MVNEEMYVGSFLNFAIECTKRHWLAFLGLFALVVAIAAAAFGISAGIVCLPSALFSPGNPYSNPVRGVGILCCIASLALVITLSFGFVKNALNLCRRQRVSIAALFAIKPTVIIRYVVAMLLTTAIVALGLILLIVPGIFLMHRLHMVPFLIIDTELGAIEAVKESWYLTTGHFMDLLFGFFVGAFFFTLFSALAVTLIFTIPMLFFLSAYPYLRLTGQLDYIDEYILPSEAGGADAASGGAGGAEDNGAELSDAEPNNEEGAA